MASVSTACGRGVGEAAGSRRPASAMVSANIPHALFDLAPQHFWLASPCSKSGTLRRSRYCDGHRPPRPGRGRPAGRGRVSTISSPAVLMGR
jgi:hypothetical protein